MSAASWFHCSVKPVSRSAGRSVVAAAAYRLGERLHDQTYDVVHDYTRKRGIESSFTVTPEGSPDWAHNSERLWNAAEQAEKRKNSTLAREVELALPSFLSPGERQNIAQAYAAELVGRYGVAVSVAMHEPGRNGDNRNYHAHILFTTREMTPEGLGKKTRILDDKTTGPKEVTALRELAANLINDALKAANSDIRVDHRSFKDRGVDRDPTTHLGPAATEMERRGEASERGEINRQVERGNTDQAELMELESAIAQERERIASPPTEKQQARERVSEDIEAFKAAIQKRGAVADIQQSDGLKWWQRAAVRFADKARNMARAFLTKARDLWPQMPDRSPDGGLER